MEARRLNWKRLRFVVGIPILVAISLLWLRGCGWLFPPTETIVEHTYNAAEGTVFDTGMGLRISVPPAETEGKVKLTVVHYSEPEQIDEDAFTLHSVYDIALIPDGGLQGRSSVPASVPQDQPPVTLIFEIPDGVDSHSAVILHETEKGWVIATCRKGLPGGTASPDGRHISIVREQLSRFAFAVWLSKHILRHFDTLPVPLPPTIEVKEPEVDDHHIVVVEATIKSPTILGVLLPGPGVGGMWYKIRVEGGEGFVLVGGLGAGLLRPGEEQTLTLRFRRTGGHATVFLDTNVKATLPIAALDWASRLGVPMDEVDILLRVVQRLIIEEVRDLQDLVGLVKEALGEAFWMIAGRKPEFLLNLVPVSVDIAIYVFALIDARPDPQFPISVGQRGAVGRVPTVETRTATDVTATSATLNAIVNPNGLATSVHFEWGTSTAYGRKTPAQSIGPGMININVSANLTGLSPNTTYHFRVVASNSAGPRFGSNASFRTDAPAPPPFNFDILLAPSSGTAAQGGTAATTVRAWRTAGPTTSVSFSIHRLPTGVSASPSSWSWELGDQHRAVTFTVGANAPVGTHTITIQGTGGGVTRTATFTLTIEPPGIPARGQIAFVSDRDGNKEIYVMNADGTNQRNLTNHPAADWGPAWSPDGKKIAFVSTRDDIFNREIYVMNADGTNVRRLTYHRALDEYPAWSPDGKKIAFASRFRDDTYDIYWEIYVMNADGTNVRQLTDFRYGHQSGSWEPTWSPDGTKLAFTARIGGLPHICVMNADGRGLRILTHDWPNLHGGPAWSPDGTNIAFDVGGEIYVMNADGTNVRRLTDHPDNDAHPTWSPDGTRIAFESWRDGNEEIYVMNADGTNQRNLTNHPARDWWPAWSPVAP
jgi:WD40 repeat protein